MIKSNTNTTEIEAIAKAFQHISRETTYDGLAGALLNVALGYSGAGRGAVLLQGEGELLAKADARFPRERADFFASHPPDLSFKLPPDISEMIFSRREIVVKHANWNASALSGQSQSQKKIVLLCLPLLHQGRNIGILYLESDAQESFRPNCVSVLSLLAAQTAISFETVRLIEALRETNLWMIKGQQIARIGSYRWNTRTLLSRASRELYQMFDVDLEVNPIPFELFKSRIHPDDRPAVLRALWGAVDTRSSFSHQYRVRHRNGTILQVTAVGQFDVGPTGDRELEGIVADITERKAAEQTLQDARNELRQAAGLISIGELAGSITHEINQPLTGIVASAEASIRWLSRNPARQLEASESIARIIKQVEQAGSIVAGLRSLVRDARLQLTQIQLNDAVENTLILLKRDCERASVTLHTDFDSSLPRIMADKSQIQQVVLNLVGNAIQAMNGIEGRDRILRVSSCCIEEHVYLRISDSGSGVARGDEDRLFEPLFTTKKGNLGLGLSICARIIKLHGGHLWLEENGSNGATFTFTLPRQAPATAE
jgi:signal transduction histidine kinase